MRMTEEVIARRNQEAINNSLENRSPGGGPMITQQHFAEEVDINTIVRRFGLTGLPQQVTSGVYGDFSGITDYDSALETIARTEQRFMSLPAEFRERFQNDPAELVRFASTASQAELEAAFVLGSEPVVAPVPPAPVVPAPPVEPG